MTNSAHDAAPALGSAVPDGWPAPGEIVIEGSNAVANLARGRIDEIDALRAFAMSAVIAQHCKILPFGWMGVWLFFVVSGFVVTNALLSRPPGEARARLLTHFYARRAARIWPIYLGYVTVGFIVSGVSGGYFEWPSYVSLVLFYNNFQSAFATGIFKGFPVGHLWTISVEFQFYVVFALAYAFLSRGALTRLLIAFLALSPLLRYAGGLWLQSAGYPALNDAFVIYSFSAMHFDSFAAGALLALHRGHWASTGSARGLLLVGVAAMATYVGAYVLVNHAQGAMGLKMFRNVVSGILFGQSRQVWLYSAVALLSAGALAMTLARPPFWKAVTGNALIQTIGRVSYGGYVYHVLCVRSVGALLGLVAVQGHGMAGKLEFGALRFALALPLTVAVAWISYRVIERPVIAWVHRSLSPPVPA
jgi:peptidoglycan/LPS O-acetylase OafA/YrhL